VNVRKTIIELLTTPKESHVYYSCYVPSEDKEVKLHLYNDQLITSDVGKMAEMYYEDTILLRKFFDETNEIKPVRDIIVYGPVLVHQFERAPLTDFIGILAGSKISTKITSIFRQVLSNRGFDIIPLQQPLFLIEGKQKEIRNISDFEEVVELIVEDISDQYVDWAWMKGSTLDKSDEFKKFVESPKGGKVTALAVRFRDRIYYLYKDARMFTKNADTSKLTEEMSWFFEVAKRLHAAGAIYTQ
jgi:hypothetical protein